MIFILSQQRQIPSDPIAHYIFCTPFENQVRFDFQIFFFKIENFAFQWAL